MALLELVKNAYDADARRVTIAFRDLTAADGGSIEIRDDGHGMDLDTVLGVWLEPATRFKRGGQAKARTARGRFPLGEKGVGRFAADKLGTDLELVTRARGSAAEVVLSVGWHRFEADVYLDQIKNDWELREPQTFRARRHGTAIHIRGLRARWDAALLERVRNSLARLISPAVGVQDFTIGFICPDFPGLSGVVRNEVLARAPYAMQARIDRAGILYSADLKVSGSGIDLRQRTPEQFMESDGTLRLPVCGPFDIALYAWDLDTIGLRSAGLDRKMRGILKQWSGVSIYRDAFRVLPYGERDNDWLELNGRRVNNPTLRLSNNQVIGIVTITQSENPDLRDRTSREGMIDTPAFADFQHLVLGALSLLEEERFAKRHAAVLPARMEPEGEQDPVLQAVRQIEMTGDSGGLRPQLAELERVYREQSITRQSHEEALLRLAGTGVAAERMVEELANTLTSAATAVTIMQNRVTVMGAEAADLRVPLKRLEGVLTSLEHQLDILAPLRSEATGGYEDVDLDAAVQDAVAISRHRLRSAGIAVTVTTGGSPVLRARYGHIVQMVLALLDNAIYWLGNGPAMTAPEIHIQVRATAQRMTVIVADNGPGITDTQAKLAFTPFYTTRRDGTGLGLFIVRTLAERYDGTVELLEKDRLLTGANMRLQFRLP